MASKSEQISLDQELLRRIDRDPETRKRGRSAFIRNAVATYLRAKERREVDEAIRRAYEGTSDEMVSEVETLIGAQAWPGSLREARSGSYVSRLPTSASRSSS